MLGDEFNRGKIGSGNVKQSCFFLHMLIIFSSGIYLLVPKRRPDNEVMRKEVVESQSGA